ncbi:MAG: hypothetical protein RL213_1796 [Bacteroidota bacterium]|jgi:predicted PurR-regulated permease PerM
MAAESEYEGRKLRRMADYLIVILAAGSMLYLCRSVFVPLSFALLVSFLLYPVCKWMEDKGIPRGLAIGIGLTGAALLLLLLLYLLFSQFALFANEWPAIRGKFFSSLDELQAYLQARFHLTIDEQNVFMKQWMSGSSGSMLSSAKDLLYSSVVNLVLFILVPILAGLILYTRERWVEVLCRIFPDIERSSITHLLRDSITAYYNFMKGMGIVYLVVGALNSIGLLLLGIPHAILFGFIASILTFIPYVGIMVASLLPITFAWMTYDSVWYPLGVVAVFAFVQYLEANLIFPMAVSSRLSINTLVTIVMILAGGLLWGAAGMILFIPYTAILKLVADRTEKLKTLSILLGNESTKK